ncbi:Amino_oxidase domain-containing protein [Cephalotus follicularis]|uniref:Amino_oxidase domain-containing protein n=1 Tax=Cephalotus follicularis TaxID=3775 RepID=A0A1Q3CC64_CEPFO|nr:Amino_oxidase domain-containing protein [Cephalotus follicularis]
MAKKPRIVIIGAGMAGLTAANQLYTCTSSKDLFELCVVEGGSRIGGRINTSEFGGDRIEMGATWIHGIGGSPIHKIAQEIQALDSDQPWECMDGFLDEPKTIAEGGFEINPSIVESVSTLFKNLMDFAQGKLHEDSASSEDVDFYKIAIRASKICTSNGGGGYGKLSIGSFLRQGLDAYRDSLRGQEEHQGYGIWTRKLLEEAIFEMHENTQRTYTSAGDLSNLDFAAESEYRMFPGEEITIARGYLSIIEYLASVLPPGLIQLGRKVAQIEWQPEAHKSLENGDATRPVKLHFCDGSIMYVDHVIVTVSLGVLKAEIGQDSGMFNPPLPSFKTEAISRLGFGVVNKLFLQLSPNHVEKGDNTTTNNNFPFLQMAFHPQDSELRHKKIPWWMRRAASLSPIYSNSSVLLCWFAGKEAVALESLTDEEIMNGTATTSSSFLKQPHKVIKSNSHEVCNGNSWGSEVKFTKVLKSKWASDPLFLGSYSYVAVGSSGDDLDTMAEPLPKIGNCESSSLHPLQILFAGEATHRTHYSTTHGAYFSGIREANRLLQHYHGVGV